MLIINAHLHQLQQKVATKVADQRLNLLSSWTSQSTYTTSMLSHLGKGHACWYIWTSNLDMVSSLPSRKRSSMFTLAPFLQTYAAARYSLHVYCIARQQSKLCCRKRASHYRVCRRRDFHVENGKTTQWWLIGDFTILLTHRGKRCVSCTGRGCCRSVTRERRRSKCGYEDVSPKFYFH